MIRLSLSNLLYRKTRTVLAAAAIAFQVALLLVLVGLSTGTIKESGDRIENIRSDIMVLPPGSQLVLGMSSAVMPLEPVRALLEATDGVLNAAPVTFATTNTFGGYGLVFGIDPDSYGRAGRGALEYVKGSPMAQPDDLVVDQRLAHAHRLEVGQKVELLNRTFTIAGIVRDGAGVRMYVPIETLQDQLGRRGKASIFFVSATALDRVDDVVDHLSRTPALKGYRVIASQKYSELLGSSMFGIKEFHAAVTLIAVAFGFVVIAIAMYTTILERTRQIGILKSLGAGRSYIVAEVLVEAGLLTLVGVPVGFGLANLIRSALIVAYPTLNITFTSYWSWLAAATAIASAFLGAVYPAIRASGVDPVEALAYE